MGNSQLNRVTASSRNKGMGSSQLRVTASSRDKDFRKTSSSSIRRCRGSKGHFKAAASTRVSATR